MTNWNERANEVEQNSQDTRRQRSRSRARNEQIEDILKEIGPLTVENLTAKREENRKNPGMYGVDDNWFYQQLRRLGSTPSVPPDIEGVTFDPVSGAPDTRSDTPSRAAPVPGPAAQVTPDKPTPEYKPVTWPEKKPAKPSAINVVKDKFNSLGSKQKMAVVAGVIMLVVVLLG